jgi:hypothetical protein
MHYYVALPDLPSCLARLIGAKLPGGIHLLCLCRFHGHSIADACLLFNPFRTPFHQLVGFYHLSATTMYLQHFMLIFQTESGFSKKRCSDVQDWGQVCSFQGKNCAGFGAFTTNKKNEENLI